MSPGSVQNRMVSRSGTEVRRRRYRPDPAIHARPDRNTVDPMSHEAQHPPSSTICANFGVAESA